MESGIEDAAKLAEVVPLAEARETREATRRLAEECPGWQRWYSTAAALWLGKRIVDRWIPEMHGRACIVMAGHPVMLQTVITMQAIVDLTIGFSGWDIDLSVTGRWWAIWNGPFDCRCRPVMSADSAVNLAVSLRKWAAIQDEPEDPRLVWLVDGDDA